MILLAMTWWHPDNGINHSILTDEDNIRAMFVSQAVISLFMTLFVGLPFLRFSVRRNRSGYGTWMSAWMLVHLPVFCLSVMNNVMNKSGDTHLLPVVSLIASVAVISSLWWRRFYADPAKTSTRTT